MKLIIKELREEKKLTQDELAALSGIKKRTYVDYENGKADITLSKLQKIATALEVNIFALFESGNFAVKKTDEQLREDFIEALKLQNYDLRNDKLELQKDKELLRNIIDKKLGKEKSA